MKTGPLVSIVTPCWNSQAYLEQTIQSIIGQSYKNIEYIVIDGGSTDGTLEIIRKYGSHISYWVSEPDGGMYQAINKGMGMAKGEIVAYLNSDDLYYPDTISKVVSFFSNHPFADLVYGNLDFVDSEGRVLFTQIYPDFNWNRFVRSNYATIGQPAAFWRRDLIEKIGLFDESMRMAADFEYFVRAGKVAILAYFPGVLAAFRMHEASLTSNQIEVSEREVLRIHAKYLESTASFSLRAALLANDIYFKAINWRAMLAKIGISMGMKND